MYIKNIRLFVIFIFIAFLVSCWGCDSDGPTEPKNPPNITSFTADPENISPGDSTLLSYEVSGADSVKLFPDGIKLANAASGSLYVKPALLTEYILVAYNENGRDSDSVTVTVAAPVITNLMVNPAYINPGDSCLLSYQVSGADSIKLFPNGIKLVNIVSDSLYVKPSQSTEFILIAYNENGQDSDSVKVIVATLVVLNGFYYIGEMGSDVLTPPIALTDSVPVLENWFYAAVTEGDGTLAADSVQPGADDTAYIEYNFDGSLGHAVIRTWLKDIDTADLFLRAATIIPGDNFQGQYILYRDTYALIQEFYGNPAAVVNPEPGSGYLVLDYEPSDSIVFLVGEVGAINGQVSTMDTVFKILITGSQTASTAEGIAVGATYPELFAAYGEPQTSGQYCDTCPDTLLYYDSLGLLFWCNKSDTVVTQIDLMVPDTPLSPSGDNISRRASQAASENRKYRLLLP